MRWSSPSLLLGLGCAGAAAEPADTGFCADVPVVTWESFGEGFLIQACNACHSATAPDRHGAPEPYVFDTEAQAALMREVILAVATGDNPSMPPEGGVTDDDRARLEIWLRCFPPDS